MHSLLETKTSICNFGTEAEMSKYYLLHCPAYQNERLTLFQIIKNFTINILEEIDSILTEIRIVVILYLIMFLKYSL